MSPPGSEPTLGSVHHPFRARSFGSLPGLLCILLHEDQTEGHNVAQEGQLRQHRSSLFREAVVVTLQSS